jgi:DNA-binding transcriptional LysR family regulator
MNIRQLSYFRGVVDHGSLAAAAEVLHVAQPNLSVAIRQLETEWGVILFDRATIYQLIHLDVGVGLLPSYGAQPAGSGFLVGPVSFASWIDRLALIYPRGRKLLPATQKAIQLCRSIIASGGTGTR